jgi:hypothetical protein
MNRWRVGEDRGSKETDGCPLTVHDFILLFRCHPGMDFDIRQREVSFSGIYGTSQCPNASTACLMLLRYEQRQEQKVNDFW